MCIQRFVMISLLMVLVFMKLYGEGVPEVGIGWGGAVGETPSYSRIAQFWFRYLGTILNGENPVH